MNKNIKEAILRHYGRKYQEGNSSVVRYSPDEVRDYTAMFIADATYFVLFESIMRNLTPNDPDLESKLVSRSWRNISIKSTTEENRKRVFVYEIVPERN